MLSKNEGYYWNQIQYLYAFAKLIFLIYLGSKHLVPKTKFTQMTIYKINNFIGNKGGILEK